MQSRVRYYVDTENVYLSWVDWLKNSELNEEFVLFFTEQSGKIVTTLKDVCTLLSSRSHVTAITCGNGIKNALDFQLATKLGSDIERDKHKKRHVKYVIVSNDTGFVSVVRFWETRGIDIEIKNCFIASWVSIDGNIRALDGRDILKAMDEDRLYSYYDYVLRDYFMKLNESERFLVSAIFTDITYKCIGRVGDVQSALEYIGISLKHGLSELDTARNKEIRSTIEKFIRCLGKVLNLFQAEFKMQVENGELSIFKPHDSSCEYQEDSIIYVNGNCYDIVSFDNTKIAGILQSRRVIASSKAIIASSRAETTLIWPN